MKYARIVDGIAVDVCTDPAKSFHPDLAKTFASVPDKVEPMWRLADGKWSAPPIDVDIPTDQII